MSLLIVYAAGPQTRACCDVDNINGNQKNILTHKLMTLCHRMLAHGHRMMMQGHTRIVIPVQRMRIVMLNQKIMLTLGHRILRLRQIKSEHAEEHAIRLYPYDDMSLTNKRKTKHYNPERWGPSAYIEVIAT